jgi:hypothetical protein
MIEENIRAMNVARQQDSYLKAYYARIGERALLR